MGRADSLDDDGQSMDSRRLTNEGTFNKHCLKLAEIAVDVGFVTGILVYQTILEVSVLLV